MLDADILILRTRLFLFLEMVFQEGPVTVSPIMTLEFAIFAHKYDGFEHLPMYLLCETQAP